MVLTSGETKWFGMGVVFGDYDINVLPGWRDGTVGYHTDDRKIFDAEKPSCGKKTTGKASHILSTSHCRKNPLATILLEMYLYRFNVVFSVNGNVSPSPRTAIHRRFRNSHISSHFLM